MFMKFAMVVAGALCLSPFSAQAATLLVDGRGILTGATGVRILNNFYDVRFVDGTCAMAYNGCNNANYEFSGASATAAAQALFDQVFIDSASGAFDSHPELTFGCTDTNECSTYIATSGGNTALQVVIARNSISNAADVIATASVRASIDTSTRPEANFARFFLSAPVGAVPEPATWGMMMLGFGAVGYAMRRRAKVRTGISFV